MSVNDDTGEDTGGTDMTTKIPPHQESFEYIDREEACMVAMAGCDGNHGLSTGQAHRGVRHPENAIPTSPDIIGGDTGLLSSALIGSTSK